jgi:glycine dehydrogenase subunit 2
VDGANLNALMGIAAGRPGVDVLHINLHKTFSTPLEEDREPVPVAIKKVLCPHLPVPVIEEERFTV